MARISVEAWKAVPAGPAWSVLTRVRRGASSLAAVRIKPHLDVLGGPVGRGARRAISPTTLEMRSMEESATERDCAASIVNRA